MLCRSCRAPLSTQDQAAYRCRCEACWVAAFPARDPNARAGGTRLERVSEAARELNTGRVIRKTIGVGY